MIYRDFVLNKKASEDEGFNGEVFEVQTSGLVPL